MKIEGKYAFAILLGVCANFCGNFPTQTKYIDSIHKHNQDYEDWRITFFAVQWSPGVVFFVPLIIGYLIDTIGAVPILIPLHLMLSLGQLSLTLLSYADSDNSKNEMLATLAYLFISFSYEGIMLAQIVFLANTFITRDGNTRVYQCVMLLSFILNQLASQLTLIWRLHGSNQSLSITSGCFVGCLLCVIGVINCIVLNKSSWSYENFELSAERYNNATETQGLLRRHSRTPSETYANLNHKGTETESPSSPESSSKKGLSLNFFIASAMVGFGCFEYLIDTLMRYWHNAFGVSSNDPAEEWDVLHWKSYISLGILCGVALAYAFIPIGRKIIGVLILSSCSSLFLAIVCSRLGYLGLIFFIGALVSYPNTQLLYLPHLVEMNLDGLGVFVGFYRWIVAIVYLIGLLFGTTDIDNKNYFDNMKEFYWGKPYHDRLAFPMAVLMIVPIFGYAIRSKILSRYKNQKQEQPEQIMMKDRKPGYVLFKETPQN